MRWHVVVLLILVLPAGALADGWYYPGDTWEENGILYSVEGTDYDTVLLGVDGRLVLLSLDSCKSIGNTEYCYTESAYPSDEEHIKYDAGEKLYAYYLTISSREAGITVSREVDDSSVNLDDEIRVDVTVKNDGGFTVNDLTYTVLVPEGFTVVKGPLAPGGIRFKQASLPIGQQTKFTYTVRAAQFGEYTFTENLTYELDGTTSSVNPGSWAATVDSPLTVATDAPDTLEIDEQGTYEVNITNDENARVHLKAVLLLPEGVEAQNVGGFTQVGRRLSKEADLEKDENVQLSFDFFTPDDVSFPLNLSFSYGTYSSQAVYTESVDVASSLIEPDIRLVPWKGPYRSGTELTGSGVLENTNEKVRFRNVKGLLDSSLWDRPVRFDHESFTPGKTLTEVQKRVTLPEVGAERQETFSFSGSYETPKGTLHTFSTEKSITVVPSTKMIRVTRTITPQAPKPGENITVVVNARNERGTYATIDVHDSYPKELRKAGGLTFAETSLEADVEEKLYQYELAIPEDYPGENLTITTIVRLENGITEETPTTVLLRKEVGVQEAVPREEQAPVREAAGQEERPGFFTRLWRFIAGLLS